MRYGAVWFQDRAYVVFDVELSCEPGDCELPRDRSNCDDYAVALQKADPFGGPGGKHSQFQPDQ